MTAVGKILVFVNLVFSLIVAALIVTVYMSQTRWAAELKKSEANNKVLEASNDAFREEAQRANTLAANQVAAADARAKKAEDERDFQAGLVKERDTQLALLRGKNNQNDAVTTASQVEVTRRQVDTEKLRESLKKESDKAAQLVIDNNKIRERAVAAEIQSRALAERAAGMEKQIQQLAQDNARLKANGGGGTAVARGGANAKNPPPENVEGLVKATDPSSGLMTITIGTDAGVGKGNTMEVFRLAAVPSQSKYLGTIRIIEAGHNYAVGQPVGRMLAAPQVGDRVASRILGS